MRLSLWERIQIKLVTAAELIQMLFRMLFRDSYIGWVGLVVLFIVGLIVFFMRRYS